MPLRSFRALEERTRQAKLNNGHQGKDQMCDYLCTNDSLTTSGGRIMSGGWVMGPGWPAYLAPPQACRIDVSMGAVESFVNDAG